MEGMIMKGVGGAHMGVLMSIVLFAVSFGTTETSVIANYFIRRSLDLQSARRFVDELLSQGRGIIHVFTISSS